MKSLLEKRRKGNEKQIVDKRILTRNKLQGKIVTTYFAIHEKCHKAIVLI